MKTNSIIFFESKSVAALPIATKSIQLFLSLPLPGMGRLKKKIQPILPGDKMVLGHFVNVTFRQLTLKCLA